MYKRGWFGHWHSILLRYSTVRHTKISGCWLMEAWSIKCECVICFTKANSSFDGCNAVSNVKLQGLTSNLNRKALQHDPPAFNAKTQRWWRASANDHTLLSAARKRAISQTAALKFNPLRKWNNSTELEEIKIQTQDWANIPEIICQILCQWWNQTEALRSLQRK